MSTFRIATLHRGKYMSCLLGFVIIAAITASFLPFAEIVKILIVLFTFPLSLFFGVNLSKRESVWHFTEDLLVITYEEESKKILIKDIEYFRNLRRSGGNLLMIRVKGEKTYRCWRNKLFQEQDELPEMAAYLQTLPIEYYGM